MSKQTAIASFSNEHDFKVTLAKEYQKQIENFFGDKDQALEFLSNVVAAVQRNPKLLECTPESLLNSFVTMASLKLMPSGVSGEAFVLPYSNKGVMEAQFQMGYKGLVTLFYRAGAKSIVAELVYEKDQFDYINGEIHHKMDVFADDRGEVRGAYVIVELNTGGKVAKAMSKKSILEIAKKFSKSYKAGFGPWSEGQDPEGWMMKKTVLIQLSKLVPKNPDLSRAIAEDNKDSVISDRTEAPKAISAPKDWSKEKELLESCKTLEALEMIYADFPVEAKIALKGTFEEMKAILITESKDIV